MSESRKVRASRDGDQFHYLWAARRCLQLLPPRSELVAVVIEGASVSEDEPGPAVDAGEAVIDVAEYYASEDFKSATRIRYVQLKHSTLQAFEPWTASGLKKTLQGFGGRYLALCARYGAELVRKKVEFVLVTNRPIQNGFTHTVLAVAGHNLNEATQIDTLRQITSMQDDDLFSFCGLLRLCGEEPGYWEQRNILFEDLTGYLPDSDVDAPIRLKELITRKALSESAEQSSITRTDVLKVLQTDEDHLFPAPCLIEALPKAVPREQEPEIMSRIVEAEGRPVLIHAAGGIGKSIISTRIGLGMPEGSVTILYDCFGNGEYRNPVHYRHRCKDGIVQISNELAGMGLCHPLIPGPFDSSQYLKAFAYRLEQAMVIISSQHPGAFLCVVIDAGDNAEIAARESGDPSSFVRELLRQRLPMGVRLVVTCRSHRRELLAPPPEADQIELDSFTQAESALHLKNFYQGASALDISEFHRLSSQNARVQSWALSWAAPLDQMLSRLGPTPTSAEDTISMLLAESIRRLRDDVAQIEKEQVDRICAGLAVLRPLIPISILSTLSGVDEAATRSFAFDLGRPLMVAGGTIQFLDEPSETWFRETFKPKSSEFDRFVRELEPLALKSAYVAGVLPQLMLEAGQLQHLVDLAVSGKGLPDSSLIEKHDIEIQRLQFALKASLRAKYYLSATKLAFKAGVTTAKDSRQLTLLRDNTDLASSLLESDRIEDLASRNNLVSGWQGSHHLYNAGLLSGKTELSPDARSRLRMAHEWLRSWNRLSEEERRAERVTDQDLAELAMAHLNVEGARASAAVLRRWMPREVSFQAGAIFFRRLIDMGRLNEVLQILEAAGNDFALILAGNMQLQCVGKKPSEHVVKRCVKLLLGRRVQLRTTNSFARDEPELMAIVAIVRTAIIYGLDRKQLLTLLERYLPISVPPGIGATFGGRSLLIVRAYALRSALAGRALELPDLADLDLRQKFIDKPSHYDPQELNDFRSVIEPLLPWVCLWAESILKKDGHLSLAQAIEIATETSAKARGSYYRENSQLNDEIARLWLELLLLDSSTEIAPARKYEEWIERLEQPLSMLTSIDLVRSCGHAPRFLSWSIAHAEDTARRVTAERSDAEIKSTTLIQLARATLHVSRSEAKAYFDEALRITEKVGDENLDRWNALLELAVSAGDIKSPSPRRAYLLSRCAELSYAYVARDKHFDWETTVEAIAGLCPSSCLAVLSRWRDRRFGRSGRLLPVAVKVLTQNRVLDARSAAALIGFRGEWRTSNLLRSAISADSSREDKERIADILMRFFALSGRNASEYHEIKEVAEEYNISTAALDHNCEAVQAPSSTTSYPMRLSMENHNWDLIFRDLDMALTSDVAVAYTRSKGAGVSHDHKTFFETAWGQVRPGFEADFIRAACEVLDFELYHFRSLLEAIPTGLRNRLSVKNAVADASKRFARRCSSDVVRTRYYESFPFKLVQEISNTPESETIRFVLAALGESLKFGDPRRLFSLATLVGTTLHTAEAIEALEFGLSLYENSLEDHDGDGPWSQALLPPENIEFALAGYIWAALAAPEAAKRWEAAHVVRLLCSWKRTEILTRIVELSQTGKTAPFIDERLTFYLLHAQQWLLIALARAAIDDPHSVTSYFDVLVRMALRQRPHVLIRGFAANAALTLLDSGLVNLDAALTHELAELNDSWLPRRRGPTTHAWFEEKSTREDDVGLYFGHDMGPYWFSRLAGCFKIKQTDVECAARKVIMDDLRHSGKARWREDPRSQRNIFDETETHHSHGSYPQADDLHFYLSYHAMMIVAGDLLSTVPLPDEPDDYDRFDEWLRRHGLTRTDGRWLSDRRDPCPIRSSWRQLHPDQYWRWSLMRADFDEVLGIHAERLSVWGRWTEVTDIREQSVSISSALVSRHRSLALLRALQTTTDPHDYRIPADADDEFELDRGEYRLRGWISETSDPLRLDQNDPWAGEINYPPIVPAEFVCERMQLRSDVERRIFMQSSDSTAVFWSQTWGQAKTNRHEDGPTQRGRRLQADRKFLSRLLREMDMDLIIAVELEREERRSKSSRTTSNQYEFMPNSARLFLLRTNGDVVTV
ncbi:MAG: hypothetical protein ACJ746_01365 [Bryobacteraceae bacterium]